MRERNFVVAAAVARWTVVLLLAIGLAACERSPQGQLPETSGEPVKAERAQVEGFALVRAYPDQSEDSLAIALEFSQPLVGTQDFDQLVTFAEAMAKPSSWSLDDSGKILRYPHVSPNQDFTVKVSGELLAAAGTRLGRDVEQRVHTGELDRSEAHTSELQSLMRTSYAVFCLKKKKPTTYTT